MTSKVISNPEIPVLDINPFADDVLREPQHYHESLRAAGPIVWLPQIEKYATGQHNIVRSVFRNWRDFPSGDPHAKDRFRAPSALVEADPPEHTVRRVVMDSLLSARALRQQNEMFESVANDLVDRLLAQGELDGVSDFAEVYPLTVFPEVVGLTEAVRPHLLTYGDLVFNSGGPHNERFQRALSRAQPAIAAVTEQTQRENLRPGGLGAAVWDRIESAGLPLENAPLLVRSLLTAGVDTTIAAISAAIYSLANAPDQWELLRSDPDKAGFAFEEAIRHESPVQTDHRTAMRDVSIEGYILPAGKDIVLSIGSANHDPGVFENPGRFDISRKTSSHIGFGSGIHQCLGQHFARLEGKAILTALARKVKRIEIIGAPTRRLNNTLRAWSSIPLRMTRA